MKEEDLYDRNFVFDTFVLITKNLSPFLLKKKLFDPKNRKIVYMFCEECVDQVFYRHICEKENFLYLNGKNVLYPKSAEIVWNYIEKNQNELSEVKKKPGKK